MYYGDTALNAEDRRYRRHYSEDGSIEITNDQQTGTTSFVFYMGGDAYSAPAIWKEVHTTAQTTQQLYFLHRDHLGSIVLITDDAGNVEEKRQFDAWGNIVKLEDGLGNPLTAFVILNRGYTGHEHLLGVELIHMNGRLYDPKLHRFLSPDNYVQDPYNTQNFNRYGYVLNNPLSHVDPSGEFWNIIIGAAIGVVTNGIGNLINDRPFFQGAGKSALIGAIGGAFSMGIGNSVQGASGLGKFVVQTMAHGHLGGVMSSMSGGSYGQGFLSGAIGSGVASGAGALLHNAGGFIQAGGMTSAAAVSGGIGAEIAGGNFWDGIRNGAISGGLNHAAHIVLANRQANLQVKAARTFLKDLGYSSDVVDQDIIAHRDGSVFKTKYARMNNFSRYEKSFTGGHSDSVSKLSNAYESVSISAGNNGFNLKYYPSRNHSVGIVLSGVGHYFEAGFEAIDGIFRDRLGFSDNSFYDMHRANATYYLNFRNK